MKNFEAKNQHWVALLAMMVGLGALACKEAPPAQTTEAPPPAKVAEVKKVEEPKKVEAPAKPSPEEIKAKRNAVDKDGIARRGKKLSAKETVTVALAFAKSSEIDGQFLKVSGNIAKTGPGGCWFVISEGSNEIRVNSPGCSILVPEDTTGMHATVEGTASVKEEKEGDTIKRTVKLNAVGAEFRKSS